MPRVARVGQHAFHYCTGLQKLRLGTITDLSEYAFAACSELEDLLMTYDDTEISSYVFQNAEKLNIDLVANKATSIKSSVIAGSAIKSLTAPLVASINSGGLQKATALKRVDLGGQVADKTLSITSTVFSGCSVLDTVILRYTHGACSLSNTNAFSGTPIESGTGFIYVPDDLVETYKTAANWNTFANQIKSLSELPE